MISYYRRLWRSHSEASGRFAHIDAMRAFAVMLVVVAHAGLEKLVPGGSGVTIFFAISGFIITYLMLRERDRTRSFAIGNFYARRALKLGPPLVVVVLVPTLIYLISHSVSGGLVASQVFFVYNWCVALGIGSGHVLPGSGVVWSLAIEEQFYIVIALVWLIFVNRANSLRLLMSFMVVIAVYSLAAKFVLAASPGHFNRFYYGTDTRADGLAFGVFSAGLYYTWSGGSVRFAALRRWVSSPWVLPVAAIGFLITLGLRNEYFRDTVRYPLQGLCACGVILFGLLASEGRATSLFTRLVKLRAVQFVGRASYSIYLTHFVLYSLIQPHLHFSKPIKVAALVVCGVAAGSAVHMIVEMPFEELRGRLRTGSSVKRRPMVEALPAEPSGVGRSG